MAVLDDDMKRVVETQRLGFVATVSADGTANLSPKGTTAVWDDDHLVFADLASPGTVANIEAGRDGVEVNVVDPFRRLGYRFKGRATVHRAGPTFEAGLDFYETRSELARHRVRAVVLIRVESARRLVSPGYDDGTTVEAMEREWLVRYGVRRIES